MRIVVDLDGTLADGTHREFLVDCAEPDWRAFLKPSLVAKDKPIQHSHFVIKQLMALGHDIIYLSGRNEGLRKVTLKWLRRYYSPKIRNKDLFLRPKSNDEKPTEFKKKQLKKIIKKRGKIGLAIDNDKFMMPVYSMLKIIPLLAPFVWEHIFHFDLNLGDELYWRK